MKGSGSGDGGRYAPLNKSHQRIAVEQAPKTGKEIKDRNLEQRDRDREIVAKAVSGKTPTSSTLQAEDASRNVTATHTPNRAGVGATWYAFWAQERLAQIAQAQAAELGRAGEIQQPDSGAEPKRPVAATTQQMIVPEGPAPGETQQHFEWRRIQAVRIARDTARHAARSAAGMSQTTPKDRGIDGPDGTEREPES